MEAKFSTTQQEDITTAGLLWLLQSRPFGKIHAWETNSRMTEELKKVNQEVVIIVNMITKLF